MRPHSIFSLRSIQLICAFLLVMCVCAKTTAQLSSSLKKEIEKTDQFYSQRSVFDELKQSRIKKLKDDLIILSGSKDWSHQYDLHRKLYQEYFSFKSYEAFNASMAMGKLADQLQSDEKKVETALCKAEILLCSGLFKEAIDILNRIQIVPEGALKVDYYRIMTRLYGDLKTYNDVPHFKQQYEQLNHAYADSLLQVVDTSSVEYQMVASLKLTNEGQPEQALEQCIAFLEKDPVSDHHQAMIFSCMAWSAAKNGDKEAQIRYLLKSNESDIRSSTYETTSGRILAQLLLANGEIELAHQFVLRAIEDAEFYGARQRKAEITHIVPIIETQLKELQQFKIKAVSGILVLILVSLLVILFLMGRLMKRHKQVKSGNEKINEQNALLSKQNAQLAESNKIKEEYLTNYFELSSVYFHEMEKMQDKISSLLVQKKYAAITEYLAKSGPQEDKERLFARFDELFLSLFPTFITALNTVLDETVQIPEEGTPERLTSELRVFAFTRLGITSADRIASILGVSRNTVYTYRNRIKTKVNMSPAAFDQYVLDIPAY